MKVLSIWILICVFLTAPLTPLAMKDIRNFKKQGQMLEFLKTFTWFDLKGFYYSLQSTLERSKLYLTEHEDKYLDLLAKQIQFSADCLEMLKEFRLMKIMEIILAQVEADYLETHKEQGNCTWKTEQDEEIQQLLGENPLFQEINSVFAGSVHYIWCPDSVHIFSFFGSETPTSDLDYSLYRFSTELESLEDMNFFAELQNTVDINYFIENVQNQMAMFLRGDLATAADQLLDMNGYPDMYVLYHFFYKQKNLSDSLNNADILDVQYTNYFSSILLRICNFVQIQTFKIFTLKFDKATNKILTESVRNCHFQIIQFKEQFEAKYIRDTDLRVVLSSDSDRFKANLKKFNVLAEYYQVDPQKVRRHTAIKKFKDSSPFHGCLSRVTNIGYFLDFMKVPLDEVLPESTYKDTTFTVYNDMYLLGKNQEHREKAFANMGPNWLNMPFIAACFSLANEAYSSIGPLEYVKFQGLIHSSDQQTRVVTNFMTLWETFNDNISMMLSHMLELPSLIDQKAVEYQGISDAYCKYLRRALGVFGLSSYNAFGDEISSFTLVRVADKFADQPIWQFFEKLQAVPEQNKKALYFALFQAEFKTDTIKDLAIKTFKFYHLIFNFILDNFDVDSVFLSKPSFQRLIQV